MNTNLSASINAVSASIPTQISGNLVYGMYTGDDTGYRTISLGFTPRFVLVTPRGSLNECSAPSRYQDPSGFLLIPGGDSGITYNDFTGPYLYGGIVTNGFWVGCNDSNNNAFRTNCGNVPYYYIAYK